MFSNKLLITNHNDFNLPVGKVVKEVERKFVSGNRRTEVRLENYDGWFPMHIFNKVYYCVQCASSCGMFKKSHMYFVVGIINTHYGIWRKSQIEYVEKERFPFADEFSIITNQDLSFKDMLPDGQDHEPEPESDLGVIDAVWCVFDKRNRDLVAVCITDLDAKRFINKTDSPVSFRYEKINIF